MAWYGMLWYGMVWYGMVWHGMHGVDKVWHGMVWYGTVWYGMVWYGPVWHDSRWRLGVGDAGKKTPSRWAERAITITQNHEVSDHLSAVKVLLAATVRTSCVESAACCINYGMIRSYDTYMLSIFQAPPSGCVRREIPRVTQVDEKGHEGNTAVATAYLCWRKHGQRDNRPGVFDDYYYWLWTLHYTRTSILLSTVLFPLDIIILAKLWVAGEGPTIEWSYLPRKIVREKRPSFRGHGHPILLY